MSRFHTSGYLFGRKFRNECMLFVGISTVILLSFFLLIWYDLLASDSYTHVKCVAVAVISAGTVCIFRLASTTFQRISAKYEYNSDEITNTYMQKQFTINMEDGYFLSKVPIMFFLGKGNTTKVFFLFSKDPICYRPNDYYGANAIEAILRNRAVLLPYESKTIQWCMENVRMEAVPSYPSVAYMPPKSKEHF